MIFFNQNIYWLFKTITLSVIFQSRGQKSLLFEEHKKLGRQTNFQKLEYMVCFTNISNKLENISFSAKIFCESEIQSQNLNLVLILCVAVSSKVCVFFSWFFKFHPSKSRNSKFRNQNKRVFLGIIFPAHTVWPYMGTISYGPYGYM